MKKINRIQQLLTALYSNRWYIIPLLILFLALLYILYQDCSSAWINGDFNLVWSPWVTIGTFALTIIIGIQNANSKWEKNLDKKLTAHFKVRDEKDGNKWNDLMCCKKVSLANEGDIRAFTQQIGRQMTGVNQLKFDLNYDREKPKIIRMGKKWVKHYEVTYYLTEFPKGYTDTGYKVWSWTSENKLDTGKKFIGQQCTPLTDLATENGTKSVNRQKHVNLLLLNFSNHLFTPEQETAALEYLHRLKESIQKDKNSLFTIVEEEVESLAYLEFPHIDPAFDAGQVEDLVAKYIAKIKELRPLVVHISGEHTFCYQMIIALQKEGIECIASTTERNTLMEGDKKISIFNFVQFRKY